MKMNHISANNFTKIILILTLCILASAAQTNAAPPANDNLANASVLSGASGTTSATTSEATTETGESYHTTSDYIKVHKTVWFSWTATQTKPAVFEVTSSSFDAAMDVETGNAYPIDSLNVNNDAIGNRPRIEFMAVIGTTYKIAVGVYSDPNAAGGSFTMQWTQTDTPANNNFAQGLNLQTPSGAVALTNQNATSEPQEPNFGNGNTVWVNFTNTTPNDFSVSFNTAFNNDPSFDTTLAVYTGAALSSLLTVVKNDNMPAQLKSQTIFLAKSGVTYHIAVDSKASTAAGNICLSWFITKPKYYTDFGTKIGAGGEVYYDESADITVFRPSDGVWYSLDSSNDSFNAFQFGLNGDKPVPSDFDGDGMTDYAVTRSESGLKVWYIRNSFDGSYRTVQWGLSTDKEVPGDYDADGRTDLAVFRPSNNIWYIWRSSDHQFFIKEFGLNGDIPVLGDFKGTPDGTDLAVFRPSNGTWYIFDGTNTIFAPFGQNGDKPVPADYDADGKTDLAVFRASESTWFARRSSNGDFLKVLWGLPGDIPMVGDYDNNTNDPADFVVFRPSDSTWYVLKSEGFVTSYTNFGLSGDIPASSVIP